VEGGGGRFFSLLVFVGWGLEYFFRVF